MNRLLLRKKLFRVALILAAVSYLVEWNSHPHDWDRPFVRVASEAVALVAAYLVLKDHAQR